MWREPRRNEAITVCGVEKTVMVNWKGRAVLLTGASSGIGEGLAIELAKKGAALGLAARRRELLEELKNRCEEAGGRAIALPCDVTDAAAVEDRVGEMLREFGRIDVAIANAGIGGNNAETRAYDPAAVKKLIDINLLGAVHMIHAVLPTMKERGSGHLVAISSLAGFRGLPKSAAYAASKAAMTVFFESVRLDTARHGIDVTIIQPGFIKTPLTSGRKAKMPYLMELEDAIPHFMRAIEKKKRFAAFPWQLATFVRSGKFMPGWLYDRIAGGARYRE
ncbi:MAG: 3-oxoacyl-(acyl-carrier-protein) reductase [Acidobacteria bacterium OLB17]|nr:MAG: 3-oxoacyl-(acyl-carrier-protein) reductase [Acidobacteria bacterium OLB17]MCZ2392075.1 SDR family NAD(P)-dependent oxidoreductase [Acidobacteriota bacterium]